MAWRTLSQLSDTQSLVHTLTLGTVHMRANRRRKVASSEPRS